MEGKEIPHLWSRTMKRSSNMEKGKKKKKKKRERGKGRKSKKDEKQGWKRY